MKKVISTILTAALILAATGCGGGQEGNVSQENADTAIQSEATEEMESLI